MAHALARGERDRLALATGPVHAQQQCLKRLDEAYQGFFAGCKPGALRAGFPRFKHRGDDPGSRFPDAKQFVLDQEGARFKLPKLGWLRLRLSRSVVGDLRNASVKREGAQWLVSIQTRVNAIAPADLPPTLGIDLGVTLFAATSDEDKIVPLSALKRQQVRLKRYHRSVARKLIGIGRG